MTHQPRYLRPRWPGIDDATKRRREPLGDGLARAVYAATCSPGDTVEVTILTGGRSPELLLTAGDGALRDIVSLIRAAQDELPRTMGFELVTGGRFGPTPALTACLLTPSTHPQLSPTPTALRRYLETLISKGISHAIRVVVTNAGDDRHVTLHAALYDPDVHWVDETDHAAALASGTLDPATYFGDDAITSSWRLPIEGTWSVSPDAPSVEPGRTPPRLYLDPQKLNALEYDADHRPDARMRLARSPTAFETLRTGTLTTARVRAYKSFDYDPRLTVDAEALPAFLDHVPTYYDRDPWPAIPGWERLDITVESVLREAPGTEPATTHDWTPPSLDPIENLEIDDADELRQAAAAWFLTRGALNRPRTAPTAAFDVARNGRIHPVYVGTESGLAAGDLIEVVSAAARAGTTAYIVVDSTATAQEVISYLSRPICETTPTRTRLYTTTRRLEAGDQWAVYPRRFTDLEWWWTPADDLELWNGDDCLFRQARPTEMDHLVAALPHCRHVDGEFVLSDGGAPVRRVPTADDLWAAWQPLSMPVAPAFLATGLYYATVLTPTDDGFCEYHHRPAWTNTDKPRYRTSEFTVECVDRFVDQYTVPADSQSLGVDQVFPRLCTWLRTIDPYGVEWTLDPSDVARALPDDRQWRHPPHERP
mgnify:FL=1